MENFVINGTTYRARDIDFGFLVEMDKAGISIDNIMGVAAINCYMAYCSGLSEQQASNEINQHIIDGGKMDDIGNIYGQKIGESDFFRTLMGATQNEETAETSEPDSKEAPKKKTTKKSATE